MESEPEYLLTLRCILCRCKYDSNSDFKSIKKTSVQSSKKSLKDVLIHIAKCIKRPVVIPDMAYACGLCYEELTEYDQVMLQLLMHQRKLARMLETSLNTVDYYDDDDQISIKEELEVEASIDSCSEPEDDGKQEYIPNEEPLSNKSDISVQCTICKKKLCSKASLRTHMDSHAKAKICPICGVIRRDDEYLELHMNVHEGKSENECRYCPKRYSRRSNVIRHMHLHWDKKKFQCEKCGLRFSQANLLYNHKLHHEAEEKPLVCTKCGQVFKSRKTYSHHMVTHQEDRPMYPCEVCGKKFTEKYSLKIHSKTHRPATEDESEFAKKHEVLVKKKPQPVFPCIICHQVMGAKEILDTHMAREHDVISPV